jgi:hypothetical protein
MTFTTTQYRCDLCNTDTARFASGTPPPKGWVIISVPKDEKNFDRERHVCPQCVARIIKEADFK